MRTGCMVGAMRWCVYSCGARSYSYEEQRGLGEADERERLSFTVDETWTEITR